MSTGQLEIRWSTLPTTILIAVLAKLTNLFIFCAWIDDLFISETVTVLVDVITCQLGRRLARLAASAP